MPDERTVSLYRLERRLGEHRDTLERLCVAEKIPYLRVDGVRCLTAENAEELIAALALHRARSRPWSEAARPDRPAR